MDLHVTNGNVSARRPGAGESTVEHCCVHLNSDSVHDLSGPVDQIGAIAELIYKKYGATLDDEAEALFGFIQNSTNRLQSLLAD